MPSSQKPPRLHTGRKPRLSGNYATRTPGAVDQACTFLLTQLANGPLPAKEIEARAASSGISAASLKRAKKVLGVESIKSAKKVLGVENIKTATYSLWQLHAPPITSMPLMFPTGPDHFGNVLPYPSQPRLNTGLHLGQMGPMSSMGQMYSPGTVAPVAPVAPVGQVGTAHASTAGAEPIPALPSSLAAILTPEAHRIYYQDGTALCRQLLKEALNQNSTHADAEEQEDPFDIVRTVADRVVDDLFYSDQAHYEPLVEYYRSLFQEKMWSQPYW